MDLFVWNTAISFQLLFFIVSGVIFIYIRENSFKFYALYCFFILIYVLSGYDYNYFGLENLIGQFIGSKNSKVFFWIFDSFLQVIFYSIYTVFSFYFLDLDKQNKKYFNKVIWLIRFIVIIFFFLAMLCFFLKNEELYMNLFTLVFLPYLLIIFVISILKAFRKAGNHKYYFLFGSIFFVGGALLAFAAHKNPSLHIERPITIFYIGTSMEIIFFSLGLAYKVKLINDEKNRVNNLVVKHKHQREIMKLQGLLEGEEKERKRIAEELHDGIAGDLSAIKLNLGCLNQENINPRDLSIINDLTKIIDKSCLHIREISHNLSPSSITNYGIVGATKNFCKKIEELYKIKVNFTSAGERIELAKTIETHIYRIIQELLNNVVKHAEAKTADIKIIYDRPHILISVKDDGKGFPLKSNSKGIGLSNIDSRIKFMNASVKKESGNNGTLFTISINLNDISES